MGLLLREYACLHTWSWLAVHAALWLGNYWCRFLCHTEQTSCTGLFLYFLYLFVNLLLFFRMSQHPCLFQPCHCFGEPFCGSRIISLLEELFHLFSFFPGFF